MKALTAPRTIQDRSSPRYWSIARRLFWLGIVLIHVAALPVVWGALGAEPDALIGNLFRLFGLAGAGLICALKVADVRWLRINPGWRSTVAAWVVIALLHISVIERAQRGELAFSPAHLGVFLCLGTMLERERPARRWPVWLTGGLRIVRRDCSAFSLDFLGRFQAPAHLVPLSAGVVQRAGPRAPPH